MRDVAIIGAGVIGLAAAAELQRRGVRVTLIDPAEPGRECSFGNAGIIATSEIFPIISPAHMRRLPHMLLSRDAPASIRPTALPSLLPWLWRAAATLRRARQLSITATLCDINRRALPAWRNLLDYAEAANLLTEKGMLRLVRSNDSQAGLERHRDALAAYGIRSETIDGDAARELEPELHASITGGLLHHSDAHVRNPFAISSALLTCVLHGGGTLVRSRALAIAKRSGRAEIILDDRRIQADHVIVAAGLDAAPLLTPFGVKVPLQAERGYHLMLPTGGSLTARPVTFQAESCVATPMGEALRLAGTVEFARRESPPTWHRSERLGPIAQRYFRSDLPTAGAERWIGSRPSLPDSLPAIGRVEGFRRISYAFGHQHLGLTQAAITAVALAGLIVDERAPFDLAPFDIARF